MQLSDVSRDTQAQSCASGIAAARGFAAKKELEHSLKFCFGNTGTLVLNTDHEPSFTTTAWYSRWRILDHALHPRCERNKVIFIDLRPLNDFQKSRLPGANSITVAVLPKRFAEVPKTGRVVLYCDCKHAEVADRAIFLEYRGNRNIFVMPEGFSGWVRRGYPLEKTSP